MKKLFITDLDGTLLNSESQVSHRSAKIISDLSQHGALITVATARTPATVERLLQNTLTTPPAIVMTGASFWNRQNLQFNNPRFIDINSAEKIVTTCRKCGVNPFIYSIKDLRMVYTHFFGTPNAAEQKFINQRNNLSLKKVMISPDCEPSFITPDTILIFALGSTEKIKNLAFTLNSEDSYSISAYPDNLNPEISYIEIFAPGVDKASAVKQLKDQMGANHLTVFGDNLNDLSMMAVADIAVAVENALPQVKEAAHIVIDSHNHDAVARYIESHI